MLAFLIFNAGLLASIGIIHMYWNKKRDKQDALDAQSRRVYLEDLLMFADVNFPDGVIHPHVENEEFADLTDFQLRGFRYPI